MGLAVLNVDIANVARPEVTRSIEFLIDSGAIYSVVPAPILEGLALDPLRRELHPLPMILAGWRSESGSVER